MSKAQIIESDGKAGGGVESFPIDVVNRLIEGEHPVRVFREYRGITAADLARKIGISKAGISQIETRKRRPTVQRLKTIAEVLGVTVDDLIE